MVFGIFGRIKKCIYGIKKLVMRSLSLFLLISLLVTLSSFIYVLIYYITIPDIASSCSLNFLFRKCGERDLRCHYPSATVNFDEPKFQFNFKRGEQYEFLVDLHVPESPSNHAVGMFVLAIEFVTANTDYYKDERTVFREQRKSTMMRYRSPIVRNLFSMFYSPFLVHGFLEESQIMTTKVVADYEEKPGYPLKSINVILESKIFDVYDARLTVQAKLQGFRYFMYHYPVSSFLIGVPTLFPIIVLILSAKVYCFSFSKPKKLFTKNAGSSSKNQESSESEFSGKEEPTRKALKCERIQEIELSDSGIKSVLEKNDSEDLGVISSIEDFSEKSYNDRSLGIESLSLSTISDEMSYADDDDEGSIEVLMTPESALEIRNLKALETDESGKSTEGESEESSGQQKD